MSKRLIILLLVTLLTTPILENAQAEAEKNAISSENESQVDSHLELFNPSILSIDELLELRDQITKLLIEKGYNPFYELERNDKGEFVLQLQERLTELGYYSGSLSGKYDSSTAQAMKQFEKANGLDNDGKASREDQALLFSNDAIPKATPTPRPTFEPKKDEALSNIDPEEYGLLDYDAYFRNPENYRYLKVKLTGTVKQVLGNRTRGFHLLFSVGGDNIYIAVNDPGYNILDNDRLIIYAQMDGTYTYTSVLNAEITIPNAYADAIVLR